MNKNVVPWACKKCFFCTKEITSGMFGSEKKKRSNVHGNYSSGSGKKRSIECTHERYTLPTYKGGRFSIFVSSKERNATDL